MNDREFEDLGLAKDSVSDRIQDCLVVITEYALTMLLYPLLPIIDKYQEWKQKKKKKISSSPTELRKSLRIGGHKRVILYAVMEWRNEISMMSEILKQTENFHDTVTIVKIHPSESAKSVKTVKRLLGMDRKDVVFLCKESFFDLLDISYAVISSEECTTCLDAIMWEKPMVVLSNKHDFYPSGCAPSFGDDAPFLRAKTAEEVGTALRKILYGEKKMERWTDVPSCTAGSGYDL